MEELTQSTSSLKCDLSSNLVDRWGKSHQLIDFGESIERIGQVGKRILVLTESHHLKDPFCEEPLLTGVHDFVCCDERLFVCRELAANSFCLQQFKWSNLEECVAQSETFDVPTRDLCLDSELNAAARLDGGRVKWWLTELNELQELPLLEDPLRSLTFTPKDQLVVGIDDLGERYKVWEGPEWSEEQTSSLSCTLYDERVVSLSKEQLLVGERVIAQLPPLHGVLDIQPVPDESRFVMLEDCGRLTVWSVVGDEKRVLCEGKGRFVAGRLSVGELVAFVLEEETLCLLGFTNRPQT